MKFDQRPDFVEGILEKVKVVADVLCRRVDLMGDTGGELADGFEFLRVPQVGVHGLPLEFRSLSLGDVSREYEQRLASRPFYGMRDHFDVNDRAIFLFVPPFTRRHLASGTIFEEGFKDLNVFAGAKRENMHGEELGFRVTIFQYCLPVDSEENQRLGITQPRGNGSVFE